MPLLSSSRRGRDLLARLVMAAVPAGLSALAYAHWVEPRWIKIRRVTLTLPRLTPVFDGYRIALISDLHMNGFMTTERLISIVALINQQYPDLVALAGDFVTAAAHGYAAGLIAALRCLAPRDGTVAVLGNHDHYADANVIHQVIRASGLINVSNAMHSVQRGDDWLHLCGVDDVCVGEDRLDRVLNALPDDGAAILLAHEPDFADVSALSGRFDLQLSGHSHGGQVCIPFVGAPYLPPLARKYPAGLYRVGNMILYTNRGIGMVGLHVRFFCRPEVTVLTLRAPQSSSGISSSALRKRRSASFSSASSGQPT